MPQLSGVNLTLPCSSDPGGQLFTSVPNDVCSTRSPKRYLSISVRQLRSMLRHIGAAGVAVGVLFRRQPALTTAAQFEVRGPSARGIPTRSSKAAIRTCQPSTLAERRRSGPRHETAGMRARNHP
jgi:hypothetical protein